MLYILIIVIGGLLSIFLPWWIIAPVALGLSWWKAKNIKEAASISAAAVVTLWIGYATYLNIVSEVNLTDKIADLFTGGVGFLSKIPKTVFVFSIMTLIASTIGAISGTAGVQLRRYFRIH
ncbi:MAG: hypothetical protein LCH67_18105 [Bacteroidetes bacterium]|jgi:hypothetical protein|nr:hypothetical protein [Bacteroidota bacterium]